MPSLVVPEGVTEGRIDRWLAEQLPKTSRATVQRWIDEERVWVDRKPCRANHKLRPGQVIEYEPGPPLPSRAEPDPSVVLDVVYEDEALVVVNKPAGLVVHPGRGHATGTLVNGLLARPAFGRPPWDERDPRGPLRPGIVHRIDKDTSGLLVVAKTGEAREALKAQFSDHSIERAYLALTEGVPAGGRIETWHGRHPVDRIKFSSRVPDGKRAVTHVEVLESFGAKAALCRCRLDTGRTHQIRVHLSEVHNTPLLADALYGRAAPTPELVAISQRLGRQALHAGVLGFVHPLTERAVRFEAPPPEDFATALDALRTLSAAGR